MKTQNLDSAIGIKRIRMQNNGYFELQLVTPLVRIAALH
jgi:hypothetical protein